LLRESGVEFRSRRVFRHGFDYFPRRRNIFHLDIVPFMFWRILSFFVVPLRFIAYVCQMSPGCDRFNILRFCMKGNAYSLWLVFYDLFCVVSQFSSFQSALNPNSKQQSFLDVILFPVEVSVFVLIGPCCFSSFITRTLSINHGPS
jgi:hypothetical protein